MSHFATLTYDKLNAFFLLDSITQNNMSYNDVCYLEWLSN